MVNLQSLVMLVVSFYLRKSLCKSINQQGGLVNIAFSTGLGLGQWLGFVFGIWKVSYQTWSKLQTALGVLGVWEILQFDLTSKIEISWGQDFFN
jgi:hypothetical protein